MHLRPIWKGKLIWENALPIFERLPNASALTQLAPASLCSDVSAPCPDTSTRRRVCTDASVPTRPRRRVHAPTRLHRRVCTDASAPTRPGRRVYADASTPTRLRRRVWADASAPTRLRRCVPSGLPKYGFSFKNFDSARDLLKKLEKTSSEITTFAKNDHPYRSCGISAVDLRSLQKWKIAPKSSIPLEAL